MGTREAILQQLQASPGLRAIDLARTASVDRTTVAYHLRKLARQGAAGRQGARWFAAGSIAPRERAHLVAQTERGHVLHAVRARPGAPKGELARELGCARGTLAWHLRRLQGAGLVRVVRDGRAARVWPAE